MARSTCSPIIVNLSVNNRPSKSIHLPVQFLNLQSDDGSTTQLDWHQVHFSLKIPFWISPFAHLAVLSSFPVLTDPLFNKINPLSLPTRYSRLMDSTSCTITTINILVKHFSRIYYFLQILTVFSYHIQNLTFTIETFATCQYGFFRTDDIQDRWQSNHIDTSTHSVLTMLRTDDKAATLMHLHIQYWWCPGQMTMQPHWCMHTFSTDDDQDRWQCSHIDASTHSVLTMSRTDDKVTTLMHPHNGALSILKTSATYKSRCNWYVKYCVKTVINYKIVEMGWFL